MHMKAVATTRFRKGADIALCIFGVIVMAYTTTLTVMNWVGGAGTPAEKAPGYCDD
jgi:proton-coupled amino acid transporter